jgi:hypothetical protein
MYKHYMNEHSLMKCWQRDAILSEIPKSKSYCDICSFIINTMNIKIKIVGVGVSVVGRCSTTQINTERFNDIHIHNYMLILDMVGECWLVDAFYNAKITQSFVVTSSIII